MSRPWVNQYRQPIGFDPSHSGGFTPPVQHRTFEVKIGFSIHLWEGFVFVRNPPPGILRQWLKTDRLWTNKKIRKTPLSAIRRIWRNEVYRHPVSARDITTSITKDMDERIMVSILGGNA